MNGALSSIATMYIQRDKLVLNFQLVHNGDLEFGTDFIVKDLEINVVPPVGEPAHDGVIGSQSVFIRPVYIRGAEDCVAALWKAIVMYWLPLQAQMGSLLVSSV